MNTDFLTTKEFWNVLYSTEILASLMIVADLNLHIGAALVG